MRYASLLLLAAACGGQDAGAPADPGGGVSFGGAQDIGEFRAILDRGAVPGPETLDANGFFNEHYSAPPATPCADVLCLTPGLSVGRDWLTGAHQATLQIAVNTNVDPADYHRLPMNLVVVVDHSGSMASDGRLDKVKVGLHALVDNLQPEDHLAIVEFDDQVNVDAALDGELDRDALHAIVDALQPRGGTDIHAGLAAGFELLGEAPALDHQNRVILLSDGLATSGDTSEADILDLARGRAEAGIGLTTIGVGDEFDVSLMRGLAEIGAGNFYFLEDPTAATEVFAQELDYFVQPLALDVHLEATAGGGYDFGTADGSHLWAGGARSGAADIPAVFVASRTSQTGEPGRRGGGSMIFIHVDPNGHNVDGTVAALRLTYRLPGEGETRSQSVTLQYANDPEATPETPYLSSPEMSERYAMYNMYLGFRAATRAYSPSCASAALAATRRRATVWNSDAHDPDLDADLALLDEYAANLAALDGSAADVTVEECAIDPYATGDDGSGDGDDVQYGYGCADAGGGGARGFAMLALVGGALTIRKRRR